MTAIFTGLRASEFRGLRWSDVDLAGAVLHVRQRADKFNVIGAPKSASSERSVPLTPIVINALREQMLKRRGDLVFVSSKGPDSRPLRWLVAGAGRRWHRRYGRRGEIYPAA